MSAKVFVKWLADTRKKPPDAHTRDTAESSKADAHGRQQLQTKRPNDGPGQGDDTSMLKFIKELRGNRYTSYLRHNPAQ